MKKILLITAGIALATYPLIAETKKKPTALHHQQELDCLKANIFFEARGESSKGKAAVAKVTLNRVKSKKYPNGVCSTVFQRKQFSWSHQQPWGTIQKVMNGDLSGFNALDRAAYQESKKIAEKGLKMRLNVLPDNVLHYHADYVQPRWAKKMKVVAKIDRHVFLKEGKK
jgi:spore germination cell wall hydrolase CwlJ-like protein